MLHVLILLFIHAQRNILRIGMLPHSPEQLWDSERSLITLLAFIYHMQVGTVITFELN